jgi:hypothetical protein
MNRNQAEISYILLLERYCCRDHTGSG